MFYKTLLFCYFSVLLGLAFNTHAKQTNAQVKTVSTSIEGKQYILSADVNYALSDETKEALQNGVPLFWEVQIKVQQIRALLWYRTLRYVSLRYRLQYHILLNHYRVNNETTGEITNFSTLPAALNLMATVRHIPLIATEKITPDRATLIAIKVYFDRNALPLPLRQTTYLDSQWYLSSDWTTWPLSE